MNFELLTAEQLDKQAWDATLLADHGNPTQLAAFGALGGRRRTPLYVQAGTTTEPDFCWLMYRFDPLPGMRILDVRSEPFGPASRDLQTVAAALAAVSACLRPMRVRFHDLVFNRWQTPELMPAAGLQPVPAYGSIQLDLQQEPAALRQGLQKKMRNRINKADKADLQMLSGSVPDGIERLHTLLQETMARSGGPTPDLHYLQQVYETLAPSGAAELFIVQHEGRDVGASLELLTPKFALGWLAGTANDAPTGLSNWMQWQIILRFAEQGVERYDLGGVDLQAPADSKGGRILTAKLKYGGELVRCAGGIADLMPWRAKAFDLLQRLRGHH